MDVVSETQDCTDAIAEDIWKKTVFLYIYIFLAENCLHNWLQVAFKSKSIVVFPKGKYKQKVQLKETMIHLEDRLQLLTQKTQVNSFCSVRDPPDIPTTKNPCAPECSRQ